MFKIYYKYYHRHINIYRVNWHLSLTARGNGYHSNICRSWETAQQQFGWTCVQYCIPVLHWSAMVSLLVTNAVLNPYSETIAYWNLRNSPYKTVSTFATKIAEILNWLAEDLPWHLRLVTPKFFSFSPFPSEY